MTLSGDERDEFGLELMMMRAEVAELSRQVTEATTAVLRAITRRQEFYRCRVEPTD